MTTRLNFWLLLLLLIVAIPYYWFLVDGGAGPGSGDVKAKPLTIEQLRSLAASIEGQYPVELRVENIGTRDISRNMLVAGEGLRLTTNVVRAYELLVPGSGPIVIDAGISEVAAKDELDTFDPAAQTRVEEARTKAAHVILLSDRPTHNGGLAPGSKRIFEDIPAAGTLPYALVPGVVVIPATGMQAGTNMVYVRMSDDHEYLFAGDVAKLAANWQQLRLPARLATRGETRPYRAQSLAWLHTIRKLHMAAPSMTIVAGHDPRPVPFASGTFSQ